MAIAALCAFAFAINGTAAQEITVKSAPSAATAAERLRSPGDDPYADPIDWATLPPWRQTAYFGVRAKGQVFVYVVDCSGSMDDAGRLARAKIELRRSIFNLRWPQRYHVIFYNDHPIPLPAGPRPADIEDRRPLLSWMALVEAEGETDPRAAMKQAVGIRPDAVFLLSDGAFPEGTASAITRANPRKVPIHCIDLSGGAAGDQLKQIARENGGRYSAAP